MCYISSLLWLPEKGAATAAVTTDQFEAACGVNSRLGYKKPGEHDSQSVKAKFVGWWVRWGGVSYFPTEQAGALPSRDCPPLKKASQVEITNNLLLLTNTLYSENLYYKVEQIMLQ